MKITNHQLRSFVRRQLLEIGGATSGGGAIPQRLQALEAQMKKIAMSEGFPEVAESVRAFNSGYIGVSYTEPDGAKMMLLDQPGAVGPEDQTGGYVWFGLPKFAGGLYNASTSIQGVKSFAGKDAGGRYGDVDITEADRREVYNEFLADFMGLLNELR